MNNSITENIRDTSERSRHVKPLIGIGSNIIAIIDKAIVQELGISENDTYVQEEITPDGILLRIRRLGGSPELSEANGCGRNG